MGEKTPDTDESGIERRNVLKGLGFGAMSAVGAGTFAGQVAAQEKGQYASLTECNNSLLDYAMLVPPGEEADEANRQNSFSDEPTGGMDLLFQLDSPGVGQSSSHTIAYQITFVREGQGNNSATKPVEDGRTRGFAGTVQTTPGGETQRREEFSTSGMSGSGGSTYWVVLMVADYAQLPDALPVEGGVIRFDIS